ncbi:MAG: type II toxin-antitoxin system HicA family toxin [Patescibacteria group bacterium]
MSRLSPIHYKKLAHVFERSGFVLDRVEGDHLIYVRKGTVRPVVIPKYRSVPVFIILNNLRSAGMSREEYFVLLRQK